MPATSIPIHSATVVALRPRHGEGYELFMVRRHSRSGFMGGAYVYPGGKLDGVDGDQRIFEACEGPTAQEAHRLFAPVGERLADDAPLTPAQALALHVAALRELFEEAGILMAHDQEGGQVDLTHPAARARFVEHRRALNEGSETFGDLVLGEKLTLPLHELRYFAHWITPAIESRRFNARFFFARAPEGQDGLHEGHETVESAWLTPSEALDKHAALEIELPPPTLRTLEDMAAFDTIDSLLEGMTNRPVLTVMPKLDREADKLTLLLPGDPRYPSKTSMGGHTRFEHDGKRWWSRGGD